ncbi:anti-sigma-F factor Fin [Gracilibacillus salinarum]|uniref:Anti-sigma-F factor Fin family protein n=1 Tax=Gracilibacillus salinarum TaxID=2932255 RepID=A0ABY4GJA7_9BACI|nr:anti-sigma-F factor Fin [Gracilibacillus salinarum]UOQ83852.1 anti-sigma-F factor Fin family protein [Gracilibacillus salinarum]
MTLIYSCKHCGTEIGRLQPHMLNLEKIGWHVLSMEEKEKLIQYHPDQPMTLQSICENCQQLLDQHPQYHELDYFIQ